MPATAMMRYYRQQESRERKAHYAGRIVRGLAISTSPIDMPFSRWNGVDPRKFSGRRLRAETGELRSK